MTNKKKYTKEDIKKAASNLQPYATEMDSIYSELFGSDPAGDYITNIMGKETHYGMPTSGYSPDNLYSMGLTQVDPIKYQDFLDDYNAVLFNEKTQKHHRSGRFHQVNKINEYMQSLLGYEDWDMTKLANIEDGKYTGFSKHAKDPRTAFMLTRMLMFKDKEKIPVNLDEQASQWDRLWNRNPDAGTPEEFLKVYDTYRATDKVVNETVDNHKKVNAAFDIKKVVESLFD